MQETLEINITDYIKKSAVLFTQSDSIPQNEYLQKIGFINNPKGGYTFQCNTFSRFFLEYVDVILLSNEEELALYNQQKGVYELNASGKIAKIIKYFINLKEEYLLIIV